MEYYSLYRGSRDAAWRALLDFGVSSLPVSTHGIADQMSIPILSFEDGSTILQRHGLWPPLPSVSGLAVREGSQLYIFFDPATIPSGRARFTIAHELGHILLGHMPEDAHCLSRSNTGDMNLLARDPKERSADIFASRFLAPACVLHGLGAYTPEAIQQYSGLSHQAATYRAERLAELCRRNAWFKSPLERQVYEQFSEFIAQQHRR